MVRVTFTNLAEIVRIKKKKIYFKNYPTDGVAPTGVMSLRYWPLAIVIYGHETLNTGLGQ